MPGRYNPDIHHRRSIRLKGFDYSQTAAYFITICTHNRECFLGEVVDGTMILNEIGKMVKTIWDELPHYFSMELDAFVIMPNHLHGIIIVGAQFIAPSFQRWPKESLLHGTEKNPIDQNLANKKQGTMNREQGAMNSAPTRLGKIVRTFKALCTCLIRKKQFGFGWQRNYHEHIIRNENDLNRIREYIAFNPARWAEDEENPLNVKTSLKLTKP